VYKKLLAAATLLKLRVSLAVVLSTAVGYVMVSHSADTLLFIVSAGVLLMAMGSAVLNHVQEHRRDSLMERTRSRPVPAGMITPPAGAILGTALAISGLLLLLLFAGPMPATLGLTTLLLYNAIYTPLKALTPYALLPGSLVGAIPPAIGFAAAGGNIFNPHLITVCLFFFIWQVPHFLLLLLKYGDEYLNAGFKTLNRYIPTRALAAITLVWMTALAISAMILVTTGVISHTPYVIILAISSATLFIASIPIVNTTRHPRLIPRMFRWINIFMVLVAHLIMFQHLYYSALENGL
jgi:heme o synthase